jgi:hypothetical protein
LPKGEKDGQIQLIYLEDFIKALRSRYHSWLELLFTEYYYFCNRQYKDAWKCLTSLREEIVKADNYYTIDVFNEYLASQYEIMLNKSNNEVRRENKRLAYVYRIYLTILNYTQDLPYELNFNLSKKQKDTILNYKINTTYSISECLYLVKEWIRLADKASNTYKATHQFIPGDEIYKQIESILEDI